jgi:hypothetical protein
VRNLSKQNRKKIFNLIKRDCTFVGSYDLEHSEESVLTYLQKPGTQIHKDVEEVRIVKNRKTGNWVESVVDIRWKHGMTLVEAEMIEQKYQCKSNR